MAILFAVLGIGLLAIAFEAWRHDLWPAAIGAAAIGAWLLSWAIQAWRRR